MSPTALVTGSNAVNRGSASATAGHRSQTADRDVAVQKVFDTKAPDAPDTDRVTASREIAGRWGVRRFTPLSTATAMVSFPAKRLKTLPALSAGWTATTMARSTLPNYDRSGPRVTDGRRATATAWRVGMAVAAHRLGEAGFVKGIVAAALIAGVPQSGVIFGGAEINLDRNGQKLATETGQVPATGIRCGDGLIKVDDLIKAIDRARGMVGRDANG